MENSSAHWTLKEVNRIATIKQAADRLISAAQAAEHLGLSERQVFRMIKSFRNTGADGLRHKNKSRRPPNCKSESDRNLILEVFLDWKRKTDEGLNASHLRDILERDHGLTVSRSTCWRLLKTTSLFTNTRRVRKHRKRRDRREQEGDILYLDGSPHRWFGEQHPKATLLLCVDDATSKALWATFVREENRNGCFEVAYEVFTRFGLPRSFWLDRASQFITTRGEGQVNRQTVQPTHWQDAMYALGVRLIFASSPQARGRGERANGTFQDRLAAELQFRSISTLEDGTKYMNEIFIPEYNRRFSVPALKTPAWRPVPDGLELRSVLAARDERKVHHDNTVRHGGVRYQLLEKKGVRTFARDKIEVQEWYDGSFHIIHSKHGDLKYQAWKDPRKDSHLFILTKSLKQRPDKVAAT